MEEEETKTNPTTTQDNVSNTDGASGCEALKPFRTYGWKPDPHLSVDDNLLDLLLIVTRSSTCRDGGMACIITKQTKRQQDNETASPLSLFQSILAVATNRALYSVNDSDLHAEVCALGACARHGHATEACTAYITMPPCKKCLGSLVVSGIQTLVFPRHIPPYIQQVAAQDHSNLTIVHKNDTEEWNQRRQRIQTLIETYQKEHPGEEGEIAKRRKQRKEEKQQRKQRKLEKDNAEPTK
ncbi:expressed unknown protein [Seminavis robusta]|uniref:CMP/dCMP-type deaminase domain-containing protein n=1 Tax=Seminavis robusta TaxID=568900 RepID=A0A9N8DBF1_9STRA|nr:expressed unknown protein [Seminavis robusta]|eukprot:Sro72_g039660.1 n/a (240) ;mRNA; r:11371-12090